MNNLPVGLLVLRHNSASQKLIPGVFEDKFQKHKQEFRCSWPGGLGMASWGRRIGGEKIRYSGLLGEKVNKSLIGRLSLSATGRRET
jgi:hypothetical protein